MRCTYRCISSRLPIRCAPAMICCCWLGERVAKWFMAVIFCARAMPKPTGISSFMEITSGIV